MEALRIIIKVSCRQRSDFARWGISLSGETRYIEEILVEDIAKIYIKEVFIRYRIVTKIIIRHIA